MAAAHDLKLCGVIRVGSSPTPGTSIKLSGILPTDSAARSAAELKLNARAGPIAKPSACYGTSKKEEFLFTP